MLIRSVKTAFMLALIASTLTFVGCDGDDDTAQPTPADENFLASELDKLGTPSFPVPSTYDITGTFAPAAYNGQVRRLAQLKEIVDSSRNEPIFWDLKAALVNEGENKFASPAAQGSSNLRTKIDELNYDGDLGVVDQSIADAFGEMADRLTKSSQANYTITASSGTAGMISTGSKKRHVSDKGLEYIQLLEKGLYGAIFYDQMVDDYLRPSQSGAEGKNDESSAGTDYASQGTSRQHKFDEAFGYFGANPATYPNADNTSNGDGQFLANYTFDFSDETEAAFGVNLAEKAMKAFIVGRAALTDGEGFGPNDVNVDEEVFSAAVKDIKLYVEAGIAAAGFHYLNSAISDVTQEDKLHHLSEALAFIYSLSFNSEGLITSSQVHDVLKELGWSATDASLNGVYNVDLWAVGDAELEAAKAKLAASYPGFENVPF